MDLQDYLGQALAFVQQWEGAWGAFPPHPALAVRPERLAQAFEAYTGRLSGNYPFFHPRYAGQMLKPPHPAAVVGYLAAMLINPNNHALDGGPPTGQMEKEVVQDLAALFQFPAETLGHLTSSGTLANLEALWVARSLHPERGIAFSEAAHYTHGRMGEVLGLAGVRVPADAAGRMEPGALEEILKKGRVGTVIATAGTTGLGAVDPIADVLDLCGRYGCRVHVDAAYGGFFTLLAGPDEEGPLAPAVRRHFRAISGCDSVAVDPHKHGLQPYGCGGVLFRDPSVGRFYKHDSPYTYFTSGDLHLGEISLECSRAGAAAGALWFTLQVLPLQADEGVGPILSAGLRAAARWHALLEDTPALYPFVRPELDIVTFFPRTDPMQASRVDEASQDLFERGMNDPDDPVFLSVLRTEAAYLQAAAPGLEVDQEQVRILRSVLMKPTHESYLDTLHARVCALSHQWG